MDNQEIREQVGSEKVGASAAYKIAMYSGNTLPARYHSLIYSKWLRSLKYGNDYYKLIDNEAYYKAYHTYIERLLAMPLMQVRLATLSDDDDIVLGFSCSRGITLDYVHVHKDYRRHGIGSTLLPQNVEVITHLTHNGMSFWTAKCPNAKFNPFV
jgi:GNAT superfamily N-acetyltransferase